MSGFESFNWPQDTFWTLLRSLLPFSMSLRVANLLLLCLMYHLEEKNKIMIENKLLLDRSFKVHLKGSLVPGSFIIFANGLQNQRTNNLSPHHILQRTRKKKPLQKAIKYNMLLKFMKLEPLETLQRNSTLADSR